ncbi:esterase-like activity of phytase family protein [Duganella sp. BJB488]|uniref:esterase-like activity of phytase family protein n=1 Tax=unclassified Duganella TaxID=2636909 RepID=UPI000E341E33|nr:MULTISPECIES: esterase-like activity of phytase family protein [unclassified Duganella]RFP21921.1 esterase-like activity of phytase family protein [Duganella sp. BJB489]RFP23712.1 esterase-like activity of phytase family protein [Duganella sp. BJB488]RFP38880.1 esterase-like activity of phytase family protein [Duganella sp. BJB480]
MNTNIFFTMRRQAASLIACTFILAACAPLTATKAPPTSIASLRFIGEQRLPWRQQFQNTMVGGLSGIDYDAASGEWVIISDDRSANNPARYYSARLAYDAQAFKSVELTGVTVLLQPDGSTYPSKEDYKVRGGVVPDLETIRVDPRDGSIWYASEGDVGLGLDPFVRHATRDGRYLSTMPLPALFSVSADHKTGPRNNLSFEGLSFAPDGGTLWVSMEGPLYQDGEAPTPEQGAVNRITHFARDGKVLGQFAYPLGTIPATPGKGKFADNGISEIVALSDTRLLAMERSGVQGADGKYKDYVRLFEIDTDGASDIRQLPSLRGASYQPARKRLVLDVNLLKLPIVDNLEGMSFGPTLANGHASLVLISDDNFGKNQVTQLLLFEVIP